MSKATILSTFDYMKQKLFTTKTQLETDITNLQNQLNEKKAERLAVIARYDRLQSEYIEVQNSNIA